MIRRGSIHLVDLEPVRGSEANKVRPAVVVSNDGANAAADRLGRGVVTVVPLTSNVQRVAIDSDTWHRVRIGPISDPAELNRIRERLKEAEVDFLVVRVGD